MKNRDYKQILINYINKLCINSLNNANFNRVMRLIKVLNRLVPFSGMSQDEVNELVDETLLLHKEENEILEPLRKEVKNPLDGYKVITPEKETSKAFLFKRKWVAKSICKLKRGSIYAPFWALK